MFLTIDLSIFISYSIIHHYRLLVIFFQTVLPRAHLRRGARTVRLLRAPQTKSQLQIRSRQWRSIGYIFSSVHNAVNIDYCFQLLCNCIICLIDALSVLLYVLVTLQARNQAGRRPSS